MTLQPITTIRSRTVVLPAEDVDTDQIIPARFLTTTVRDGLGAHAFADWRFDADGNPRTEFVLNSPEADGCEVLVAGHNFGCGSSREHAPWALLDYGFRAVISTEIADIFRSNALKNGLVPVIVDAEIHRELAANPGAEVTVDVASSTLTLPDGRTTQFPIDAFARHCLVEGIDAMGYLTSLERAISDYESKRR